MNGKRIDSISLGCLLTNQLTAGVVVVVVVVVVRCRYRGWGCGQQHRRAGKGWCRGLPVECEGHPHAVSDDWLRTLLHLCGEVEEEEEEEEEEEGQRQARAKRRPSVGRPIDIKNQINKPLLMSTVL